jgi:predicted O-methyltransferase YrrM
MTESTSSIDASRRVRSVLDKLVSDGSIIARSDGSTHDVLTVAISPTEGAALRRWVIQEAATRTIEIGLGYGVSALYVCDGLVRGRNPNARHVVLDPFQSGRFANCGLQVLEEAGVTHLIEHHAEISQIILPSFLREQRVFDLAFVDGNHRFDSVFVDLFYLGRLVRKGGIIALDDYDYPGIKRAVSFFLTNLGWTIEETSLPADPHGWVVLRTSPTEDTRDFRYFVEF